MCARLWTYAYRVETCHVQAPSHTQIAARLAVCHGVRHVCNVCVYVIPVHIVQGAANSREGSLVVDIRCDSDPLTFVNLKSQSSANIRVLRKTFRHLKQGLEAGLQARSAAMAGAVEPSPHQAEQAASASMSLPWCGADISRFFGV